MYAKSLCIMVNYCLRTIRTSRVPELDRNEASPWHRISHTSPDQSRAGTVTNVVKCMMTAQRSMVINIPIGIMQQSLEASLITERWESLEMTLCSVVCSTPTLKPTPPQRFSI